MFWEGQCLQCTEQPDDLGRITLTSCMKLPETTLHQSPEIVVVSMLPWAFSDDTSIADMKWVLEIKSDGQFSNHAKLNWTTAIKQFSMRSDAAADAVTYLSNINSASRLDIVVCCLNTPLVTLNIVCPYNLSDNLRALSIPNSF